MPPLSRGSVSLGLHRQDIADPTAALEVMLRQAVQAEEVGFDGVTLSEHHLGFPGYFPNPLAAAALILGRTSRVWSGPLPMLLPLRPAAIVAEDLAWLAAAHRGRLVAGFAAGNRTAEQALVGLEGRLVDRFTCGLETVAAALLGEDQSVVLRQDPAIAAFAGTIPLLSAVKSRTATERAAHLGYGILMSSASDTSEELSRLAELYAAAGGTGRRAAVTRVWVGPPPADELLALLPPGSLQGWEAAFASSPEETIDRLADLVSSSVVDSLNLRVHVVGLPPQVVEEQIGLVGETVLPGLRAAIGELDRALR